MLKMKRGNVSIYIDDLLDFDSIKVTCRKLTTLITY